MQKTDITKTKTTVIKYIEARNGYLFRRRIAPQAPRASDGLIYIIGGTCHYSFEDRGAFSAKEGDILYLAKGAVYEMNVDCDRYEFMVINLEFSGDEPRKSCVCTPLSSSTARQLFSRVCYSRNADEPSGFARNMELIYRIMQIMSESAERVYIGSGARAKIERCADYIHLHFADGGLTVASLAKSVSLSEVHFRKLFSSRFGLSPARYIMQTRIDHAIKLMPLDGLSLEEIAEESGFSSLPYFNKVFKAFTGDTPASYRRLVSRRFELT